jgi:hypothetical protein
VEWRVGVALRAVGWHGWSTQTDAPKEAKTPGESCGNLRRFPQKYDMRDSRRRLRKSSQSPARYPARRVTRSVATPGW